MGYKPLFAVFSVWGIALSIGSAIIYLFEQGGHISKLSLFLMAFGVISGSGLMIAGAMVYRERDIEHWLNMPSLLTISVGVGMTIFGPLIFQPWNREGLAAGVATWGTFGFIVTGIGVLVTGGFFYRTGMWRKAIGFFSFVTIPGWAYAAYLDQTFLVRNTVLLLVSGAILLFGPILATYAWTSAPQSNSEVG